MSTKHRSVVDYFAFINSDDKSKTIQVFASDAEVFDDGHTYRGRTEILRWLTGAATEYNTTSTELSATTTPNAASVTVRLEGDFPGGRVDLQHDFSLNTEDKVTRLTISVSDR